MIVIDANVLVYTLIPSPQTPECTKLWQTNPIWFAPTLILDEFCAVIAKHIRGAYLGQATANLILNEAERMLNNRLQKINYTHALDIALHYKISAYDAQYLALAETLKVPLYTFDKGILKTKHPLVHSPNK